LLLTACQLIFYDLPELNLSLLKQLRLNLRMIFILLPSLFFTMTVPAVEITYCSKTSFFKFPLLCLAENASIRDDSEAPTALTESRPVELKLGNETALDMRQETTVRIFRGGGCELGERADGVLTST
jgi:hypothetical protein